MRAVFCLTFVVLVASRGCSAADDDDFAASNRAFTAAAYQKLAARETGNFLTCPLSVQTVMALTAIGAKGDTSQQITRGLQLPADTSAIKTIFKHLTPRLRGNEYYALTSANKLFVDSNFALDRDYQMVARSIFDADIDSVDFGHSHAAAAVINEWVRTATNGKIEKLLTADELNAAAKLVLANALHFKGKWSTPFDTADTIPRPFYSGGGAPGKNVDMMQLTDYFNYYEHPELDAKFLELPYQGGDVSMVFVLPNRKDGLAALEARMPEVLAEQPMRKQHVRVQIPRFSMETTTKYKRILQEMGIKNVFTEDADLSGISADGNLLINTVIQKTFINVTEAGTEAAAATAVSILERIGEEEVFDEVSFVADRPFTYALIHHCDEQAKRDAPVTVDATVGVDATPTVAKRRTVVFVGRVASP